MCDFSLSDPYTDFDSPEDQEMLRRIEAKQGVGITGGDLMCVFQSWLPAGTPRECCAYLPALYDLFRCPGDEYALDVWDSVVWVWLVQERAELEALGLFGAIVDELRRIVREVLVAASWKPEDGADIVYRRMDMLMNWMASPWGQEEVTELLDMLAGGGVEQRLILLLLFAESRDEDVMASPLAVNATPEAYHAFAARFDAHFSGRPVLRDSWQSIRSLPLPASLSHLLEELQAQCENNL